MQPLNNVLKTINPLSIPQNIVNTFVFLSYISFVNLTISVMCFIINTLTKILFITKINLIAHRFVTALKYL